MAGVKPQVWQAVAGGIVCWVDTRWVQVEKEVAQGHQGAVDGGGGGVSRVDAQELLSGYQEAHRAGEPL